MDGRTYIAIDLKSFYASVECVERGLDPLNTNLVVADQSRTEKTICLAVSPSLKKHGIPGRARLFEVVEKVREVNSLRRSLAPKNKLAGKSVFADELESNPALELDYIVAPPQMARYMEISTNIYNIYLKYIAPEDIHVYSVDEVFIDATNYLKTYKKTAHELAMTMIRDVLSSTGITATAGIGTNMYLCKIAMDIVAKHIPADKDGVRIAELDEMSYRKQLWEHTPITDFWRVGKGYATRLANNGMYTMGDVARCSIENEDKLYKLFGINAELLIDHAWGYEPCRMSDIKSYVPESNSLSLGQVLSSPYPFEKARLIVREMTDNLVLDLVKKGLVTDQMVLTVGYDIENTKNVSESEIDRYGRKTPKSAHGSINLNMYTSSTKIITDAVIKLFDRIVDRQYTVRRMYVVANRVLPEKSLKDKEQFEQMDLFTDYEKRDKEKEEQNEAIEKEKKIQQAVISIKDKFGKNAILKGMNFEEGATAKERNEQVGGHKA
ncbi:MAG: DNA methylase [Ruminococcaceae bacterium]|jgi:DNA polymerase V|nr:DNA methylase [Oscillospiraceae bacterium]